jgi:hypothetical protein
MISSGLDQPASGDVPPQVEVAPTAEEDEEEEGAGEDGEPDKPEPMEVDENPSNAGPSGLRRSERVKPGCLPEDAGETKTKKRKRKNYSSSTREANKLSTLKPKTKAIPRNYFEEINVKGVIQLVEINDLTVELVILFRICLVIPLNLCCRLNFRSQA